MDRFDQSPTAPAFVQDPYSFYARARAAGPLIWWEAYEMPIATTYDAVNTLFRDRRFGRERAEQTPRPAHQAPFWAVEDHSMLDADPPRHTRLRAQVLRAFTSRRVQSMAFDIRDLAESLAREMVDQMAHGPVDLLTALAQPLPVRIITRMLGVPETDGPQLVAWSNAIVKMYQAGRSEADEQAAAQAAAAFSAHLAALFDTRRRDPQEDLVTRLLAVSDEGDLSAAEVTATCILLLNAGHEATVHSIGNGVAGLIRAGLWGVPVTPALVEEVLRHDPPLHLFTRFALEEVEIFGHRFAPGDPVGLLIGSANRDAAAYPDPDRFNPARFAATAPVPLSLGAGVHFCLGAQLARMELFEALRALGEVAPTLRLADPPTYADSYHFHGLKRVMLSRG